MCSVPDIYFEVALMGKICTTSCILYFYSANRRESSRYGTMPPHARQRRVQRLVGLVPCVIASTECLFLSHFLSFMHVSYAVCAAPRSRLWLCFGQICSMGERPRAARPRPNRHILRRRWKLTHEPSLAGAWRCTDVLRRTSAWLVCLRSHSRPTFRTSNAQVRQTRGEGRGRAGCLGSRSRTTSSYGAERSHCTAADARTTPWDGRRVCLENPP